MKNETQNVYDVLRGLQHNLKAPKSCFNSFGGYRYRSCENILEAVKPMLEDKKATLLICDELVGVQGKNYIKSTAILIYGGERVEVSAYAREADSQKGMVDSQLTGATASYARKYALGGMFLIDDVKDADATNTHVKTAAPIPLKKPTPAAAPEKRTVAGRVEDIQEMKDKYPCQITIGDTRFSTYNEEFQERLAFAKVAGTDITVDLVKNDKGYWNVSAIHE